ncbi:NADPH-dependent FMN reductase [Cohnella thailandensis]|uniref:NAD(P)H-dependent oxidoreductase n=1 Tax=Cohnella thailandensis TaxID=557557 RepID=A0A841T3Q2_9BACL|nr:NADPH-dependent FMN reductase [Cohnella thailandensis]MBB6637476.1 NAD(P)H-dependent oxidoreductase [Cohnella thailandensis]MBP1977509.1 azobenzene reductase [Cohnella thailandensis]
MKIVFLTGSNRIGATSTILAKAMAMRMERKQVEASVFDLAEWPLPYYSPDDSYEHHDGVQRLSRLMREADGIVLTTPEYHGSVSGVLKNALDFLGQEHFAGKPVLSVSSSGGAVGTSSLTQLQTIVRNLHGVNSPEWVSIGGAQRARYEQLENAELDARSEHGMETFLRLVGKLARREDAIVR